MPNKFPGSGLTAAAVALALFALANPAAAENHGGWSGGGHAGGGGHGSGGGHPQAGGSGAPGRAHAFGYSGGGRGYAGGPHFAPHYASGAHAGGALRGTLGYGGYGGHWGGRAHWGGGYWHGGYWPGAYYGYGFSWFLPILPLAYATYWWGGIPYYYANNIYYTWSPADSGYVVTDPPPVADGSAGTVASGGAGYGAGPDVQVFMYPKNGQSEEQLAEDRRACQQWAASQAGTGGGQAEGYHRAMVACAEGRGYTAR